MARTTVNVWGDLVGAAVIARSEGVLTLPHLEPARGA
jgi:Na+/H+-dicarboxylate symporter